MKIAFIDEDLSLRTGSRRFTYEVAYRLQKLGHEVGIFTTRMDKTKCFQKYLSLPIEVVPAKKPLSGQTSKGTITSRKKLPILDVFDNFSYCIKQARKVMKISRRIAEMKFDVAVAHYHGEHWLFPFFYSMDKPIGAVYLNVIPPASPPNDLPFQVLTLRRKIVDELLGLPPLGSWKKRSFGKLGLFLAPSKYLLGQAERRGVIGDRRARVVPLGVDHSEFCPTNEEEPFALYLGRIHPHKSLELAVLSMKNTGPDNSLIIAGDMDVQHSWYKSKLIRIAEKMRLDDRLEIIVSPSDSQVIRLMQRCSVFLFPSTIDTFGLVVLEAMSCGKPIVACNRGGVPEVVDQAGFLLEPDVKEWQRIVNRLLIDSNLRERMGKKALLRSRVFSWENTTRQLLQSFSESLD